ncbi:helix-turn-helix domain-containing protein [Flavobacterium sp. F-380]|uniref:Helix-turn-helix domain-containing protein n=1 Tax=Flavobacterium kayseriense TaxID=2764714 RepID=A0ABR7J4H1_9FLAO|nr:helix-turn-helix domain-containing protein [Flavobacterium kayseriense]MBC5840430.1 helix-turn-helix domain-containing protein [Flavobacterium kayseriense]MBC5846900.1 helix-turn-helix domain-containing protein [Flavobacterium kayseriense]
MEIILKKLEKLEVLIERQYILSKEILSLEEAAQYLQLSKSCLYKMTSRKEVNYYVPGGKRIYFRRSELETWILNSRVSSVNELETNMEVYLSRTQKSKL